MGSLYRLINVIRRLPVAVMAVMACVSCSKNTPDPIQPLSVNFRMSVPVDASAAGGPEYNGEQTWGDKYNEENALPAENRILWDDFYVTFFSAQDGAYIGHLENLRCVNLLPGINVATYECKGELTTTGKIEVEELVQKLKEAGTVKTLVTANVADLQQELFLEGIGTRDAGLGSVEYPCKGTFDKAFPAIPMWGVTSGGDFSELTPGATLDLGKVTLLRSVAKVEVLVSEELQQTSGNTVKLGSVSISRMNTTGYVLPGNWSNIDKTENLKFSETLRIPEKVESVKETTFNVQDDGRVLFYLPECNNAPGDDEIILTVNYTVEEEEREGKIHICNYDNGIPDTANLWNVVRNHLYRYIITNTGEIQFKVEVHPWNEVEIPEIMM